jgi:hypothetical protein
VFRHASAYICRVGRAFTFALLVALLVLFVGGVGMCSKLTSPGTGVRPVNEHDCPLAYPVKGTLGRSYHLQDQRFYGSASPQVCFASAAEAEAAGFRRASR